MKIRSVAIMGAGAVGSYVIWGLSQKPDLDICVIADGERKTRYERDGFVINAETYHPQIKTPREAAGTDLLIVALKYNSLKASLEDIRAIVGENTIVMSLMNGVDSEEIIGAEIGMEKIVHSVIMIASERSGNSVKFNPDTTIGIIYGEADKERGTARTDSIAEIFKDTGIKARVTDVILSEIWSKFLLNVGNNLIQAIVGRGVGIYSDSEHAGFLKKQMRAEVKALAEAKGIDISLADKSTQHGSGVAKRARYSTLQDLDNHRHTEIDMFSGAVVRMGRELGIPTPYNEYTYHMIKALEEKNDGLFDYE